MPRPTLFDHPKFQRLARILNMPRPHVLGHLEFMWRVGYSSGNDVIGDDIDVELAAEWTGEPGAFARALTDPSVAFLDKLSDGRFAIHDLHDHAPRYVQDRWRKEQERKKKGARRTRGVRAAELRRTNGGQPSASGDVGRGHEADERNPRAQTSSTPAPAPTPAPKDQNPRSTAADASADARKEATAS